MAHNLDLPLFYAHDETNRKAIRIHGDTLLYLCNRSHGSKTLGKICETTEQKDMTQIGIQL